MKETGHDRIASLEAEAAALRRKLRDLETQAAPPSASSGLSIAGIDALALRVDPAERIVYVNSALAEYLSTAKEELLEQPVSILRRFLPRDMIDALRPPAPDSPSTAGKVVPDARGRTFEIRVTARAGFLDIVLVDVTRAERQKALIRRYVSSQLADEDERTFFFPERRLMTVSFTDLRGFTAMSETMAPEEVRSMINAYLEEALAAVAANGGTVDKIIGDEVMALYGAPTYHADHALRAVQTACDQLERLAQLRASFASLGRKLPECGIGINTGDMIVGTLGNEERANYTVVGAAVNLASRLCGAAKGGQILLTEATLQAAIQARPAHWEHAAINVPLPPPPSDASGSAIGGKVERILPLPDELNGRSVLLGPGVKRDPGAAEWAFHYLFRLKVKGVADPLPVLSVERPRHAPRQLTLRDERSAQESQGERIFGPYRLVELLGRGGMGEVWRARDRFANTVAIKTLRPGLAATPGQVRRFKQEADIMRRLPHRNICRIHEVGEIEGITYIAMEYVDGVSLADLLELREAASSPAGPERRAHESSLETLVQSVRDDKSRSASAIRGEGLVEVAPAEPAPKRTRVLPVAQTLALAGKVAEAMQFAHEHGVLHRDLKPANIMLRADGEPVVMDFGLAKLEAEHGASLSISGQILGTVDYMAPEQASSSKDVTEHADVYSLGAILYQMLTGQRHFTASGNLLADVRRLQELEPPPARKLNPLVDTDLDAIVSKALRPDPLERYPSMHQFAADLEAHRNGDPVSAKRPTVAYRLGKWARKHRLPVTLGALALLCFAGLAGFLVIDRLQQQADWILLYRVSIADLPERRPEAPPQPSAPTVGKPVFTRTDALGRRETPRPERKGDAILLNPGTWHWIQLPAWTQNDIRWTVRARLTGSSPPSLRLVINTRRQSLEDGQVPSGYLAEYAAFAGAVNLLMRHDTPGPEDFSGAARAAYRDGAVVTLSLERRGNTAVFSVDGRPALTRTDLLPLQGVATCELALMAFERFASNGRVEVLGVEAAGLSLPMKASPLVAGDALYEAGDKLNAFDRYLQTAFAYRSSLVGAEAAVRAYAAAMLDPSLQEQAAEVLRVRPPETLPRPQRAAMAMLDAVNLWQAKRVPAALQRASQALADDPASPVVAAMLQARRPRLDASDLPAFNALLRRAPRLASVSLAGMGIPSLAPLQGQPLIYLDASENSLETLAPLAGKPLFYLDCRRNRIADLAPLRGMPLVLLDAADNRLTSLGDLDFSSLLTLSVEGNQIAGLPSLRGARMRNLFVGWNQLASLESLRGSAVEELSIDGNALADLDALRSLPLRTLWCNDTAVRDLSPLAASPLRVLGAERAKLADLSPLADLPLEQLFLEANEVADLRPLAGLPLQYLFVAGNRIHDLSPLAGLPLEALDVRANQAGDLAPLAGLPLAFADVRANPLRTLGPLVDNPPPRFLFAAPSLAAPALLDARARWSAAPARPDLVHAVDVELALRRRDAPALQSLAREAGGHRYLYVQRAVDWPEANRLARGVGAHLATLASPEEAAAVAGIVSPEDKPWIGLHDNDGRLLWVTGESLQFSRFQDSRPTAGEGIQLCPDGAWRKPKSPLPVGFVLEWPAPVNAAP